VPTTRTEPPAARPRLFVALELSHEGREALAAWTDRTLGDDPALRFVAADALHVTLSFLGSRDASDVDRIAAAALGAALVAADLHEAEPRPFRPHVTVARVRRGARAPSGRFPDPPRPELTTTEVVLYRSELSPGGARYTALRRVPLDSSGR